MFGQVPTATVAMPTYAAGARTAAAATGSITPATAAATLPIKVGGEVLIPPPEEVLRRLQIKKIAKIAIPVLVIGAVGYFLFWRKKRRSVPGLTF